ncbi:MAG: indole-3-glycerol phosphate synthase TrpC [Armatimonadota bacterium]
MSILDEIIHNKERELSQRITAYTAADIRQRAQETPPALDILDHLRSDDVAVIAEVKKTSPSAGEITGDVDITELAREYADNGAAAISVLTDQKYFSGSIEDLRAVRDSVALPVLRKDFIISPYQVFEARAAGADAILLIVAAMYESMLETMLNLTRDLGMTALVEVHTADELGCAISAGARLVGINNRNLKTMEVSLETFEELAPRVPPECVLVSESGIRHRADVERVAGAGADAVLVGTSLLRSNSPGEALEKMTGVKARGAMERRGEKVVRDGPPRATGWALS